MKILVVGYWVWFGISVIVLSRRLIVRVTSGPKAQRDAMLIGTTKEQRAKIVRAANAADGGAGVEDEIAMTATEPKPCAMTRRPGPPTGKRWTRRCWPMRWRARTRAAPFRSRYVANTGR